MSTRRNRTNALDEQLRCDAEITEVQSDQTCLLAGVADFLVRQILIPEPQ